MPYAHEPLYLSIRSPLYWKQPSAAYRPSILHVPRKNALNFWACRREACALWSYILAVFSIFILSGLRPLCLGCQCIPLRPCYWSSMALEARHQIIAQAQGERPQWSHARQGHITTQRWRSLNLRIRQLRYGVGRSKGTSSLMITNIYEWRNHMSIEGSVYVWNVRRMRRSRKIPRIQRTRKSTSLGGIIGTRLYPLRKKMWMFLEKFSRPHQLSNSTKDHFECIPGASTPWK